MIYNFVHLKKKTCFVDKELFNQQRVKIVGVHHIVPELVHNDEDLDEL